MDGKPAETGALCLLRAAHEAGIRMCFANPGTTEMWLVAALDVLSKEQGGGIRPVLGLHETVCTGAADGYARMARAPAAVLLHLGPGLANGLANLHNARRARTPVLCLVGQMASWHVDADPVLNMDIEALARSVSCLVASPNLAALGTYNSHKTAASPSSSAQHQPSPSTPSMPCQDWVHQMGAVWATLGCGCGSRKIGKEEGGGSCLQPEGSDNLWTLTNGPEGSRVVTLIIHHDLSWESAPMPEVASGASISPPPSLPASTTPPTQPTPLSPSTHATHSSSNAQHQQHQQHQQQGVGPSPAAAVLGPHGRLSEGAAQFVRACAAAIKKAPKGKVGLYIGGEALLEKGGALRAAGLVAAGCGAALLCENAFARLDRGAGLPCPRRLPYFPQEAAQELMRYDLLVTVDTRLPVANFGYMGGPSALVPGALTVADRVWELDTQGETGAAAALLSALAAELGVGEGQAGCVRPGVNCGGVFAMPSRPPLPPPDTKLNPNVLCAVVAAVQPEGAVVVDESLTSGGPYWELSKGCPTFSHLTLTGGAIGSGPPLALGAALAVPEARVINLQADGSAMYSLQALWSQAREGASVTTIICSNRSYRILQVECARQRLPAPGSATKALTDLSTPPIQWTQLAAGLGVPSAQASTAGQLRDVMQQALGRQGPFLIEALL